MNQNKMTLGSLFALVLAALLFLGAMAQPTNASESPRPALGVAQLLVPTPITTPSSLDALETTSDVIIGGNATIAGTLGVTGATTQTGAQTFASTLAQTLVNAASGSANPYDYTGTLGIMNGSDTFELFDINITNANHTSTTNVVRVMDIANITGDTEATETGIRIGSGWDTDIDGIGGLQLGADAVNVLTVDDPPAAGASGDLLDVTATLGIMDGSDTVNGLDLALTNANHTGSNALNGVNIGNITGDAEATEYAVNVGTGWDRGLNVAGGGAVIVGTVTLDTGEIGAAEIADVVRSINIPLTSLIECTTDAGAAIAVTDGSDTHPHFANSSTNGLGFVLRFDDSTPDTDYVCSQLSVPADYVSGGSFVVRAVKDALTAGDTEILNCAGSINGAALGTGGTVTIATQASTSYTCTPTLTSLAANDSLSFEFHITSSGTIDDVTDIASIRFTYTATQ